MAVHVAGRPTTGQRSTFSNFLGFGFTRDALDGGKSG
jgi:hypothetical protein